MITSSLLERVFNLREMESQTDYTQSGHKLRFFRRRKAQFVTVGIIKMTEQVHLDVIK